MIITRDGKNIRGGEPMGHADVVISNVTYEVSRVFSGSRSMKDLLKSQIMEFNPKTLPTYRRKNAETIRL